MKNKIYHAIGRFFQKVSRWFFHRVLMACWHCGALVGMNSTYAKGHMWCEPCFQRYVVPELRAAQHSAHPTNGTLPNLEKVPYPETSATSQAESTPPIRG